MYLTRSYNDLIVDQITLFTDYTSSLIFAGYIVVYVGKQTGRQHKRMCGSRTDIIYKVNDTVYSHFKQPEHSILSMRVCIIEKQIKYHKTSNADLATHLRRQKRNYMTRELGTATPYDCNDKNSGINILSSPACRLVNVMDIFNAASWCIRRHHHCYYTLHILP